jgi:hypothetical protein
MPPLPEIVGHVHVSTYDDFQQMGAWYGGSVATSSRWTTRRGSSLARSRGGREQRAREGGQGHDWVVRTPATSARTRHLRVQPRRPSSRSLVAGGDCKDKATVIVALLRELGSTRRWVVADPAPRGLLLEGREPGALRSRVAYVPSLDLYLDGHGRVRRNRGAAGHGLRGAGLLINKGPVPAGRLPANDPTQNAIARRVRARLAADGSADLELRYDVRGSSDRDGARASTRSPPSENGCVSGLVGPRYPGSPSPRVPGSGDRQPRGFLRAVWMEVRGVAPRSRGARARVSASPSRRACG